MRNTAAGLALAISSLIALGCGEDEPAPRENAHVTAFRAEVGLEFQECGEIQTDCAEYDCGAECSDERESSWPCIETAFETCSPAHFRERVRYSATGWSTDDVFVVPAADGSCEVVRFQVVRADEVGCNHVARWDCADLDYGKVNEEMDWCFLWIEECRAPTTLEGEAGDCWLFR